MVEHQRPARAPRDSKRSAVPSFASLATKVHQTIFSDRLARLPCSDRSLLSFWPTAPAAHEALGGLPLPGHRAPEHTARVRRGDHTCARRSHPIWRSQPARRRTQAGPKLGAGSALARRTSRLAQNHVHRMDQPRKVLTANLGFSDQITREGQRSHEKCLEPTGILPTYRLGRLAYAASRCRFRVLCDARLSGAPPTEAPVRPRRVPIRTPHAFCIRAGTRRALPE